MAKVFRVQPDSGTGVQVIEKAHAPCKWNSDENDVMKNFGSLVQQRQRNEPAHAVRDDLNLHRTFTGPDLLDEALKMAQTIASMPPLAAIGNKEMVNAAFETNLGMGLLFERRLFNGLCATADKAEGMTAFVEKRPGNWTGK